MCASSDAGPVTAGAFGKNGWSTSLFVVGKSSLQLWRSQGYQGHRVIKVTGSSRSQGHQGAVLLSSNKIH